MGKIDLGVSLYGFTERFVKEDDYGFEQMFQEIHKLGLHEVEIVGAQMFQNYPIPDDSEIEEVLRLADQYDIEPFSYGGYVDFAKHYDHDMDDDERITQVIFDLMTAHKLGCKYMRGFGIPGRLYPRIAKEAEKYGVIVCFEIHSPMLPSDPEVQELLNIFDEIQSPWVGFVPDFGCYIERPNEIQISRFLKLGAKRENLEFIINNRWNGYTEEMMQEKMKELGGGLAEKMAVSDWFGSLTFQPADIEGFQTVLRHSKYYHGKFYHIGEDCVETTIPYETLLGLIQESGFEGTVITEYEGHLFLQNDAEEQIARHIQMEKKILGL